ncbi:MAG: enoyl-CoA hydratase/isomerase family protein [Actinobacteria bacterium]|nr:enoyl-CoA hydratase/isomerase family protein [Actinomycetota bacterium]MCA1719803.1 enoyl-CoA hydratase/isomerase family protein [Actinomycetota bacterium]
MASLDRDGGVFVLDLGDTENRFNAGSVAELTALLDEVERAEGPRALVTTATGKYWSNGLDLDWMMADAERAGPLLTSVHGVLAKVLAMPVITVAAVTGHAFAGGGMLAIAHDFRVMREDRGYWCLPEVDLGLPFTPGMNALLVARLPRRTAHEAMTTGKRYGGAEALAAGVVDAVAAADEVLAAAVERAAPLAGKAGPALGEIKARMYAEALAALAG